MKNNLALANHHIENLSEGEIKRIEGSVERAVEDLLDALCFDWKQDHNMKDTPKRVAKMLVHETFRGRYYPIEKLTEFPNVKEVDQLMVVGPIDVKSTCAHHLQPFFGKAWIGVLPKSDGKIIGLSKFNRIVDNFSRRPQIQEELTSQVAEFLEELLAPQGIIVVIKCRHLCMMCRGVNQDTLTTTSIAHGGLRDNPSLKAEFLGLVGDMSV